MRGWKACLGQVALVALPAIAQTDGLTRGWPRVPLTSAWIAVQEESAGAVVREIDDPQNGNRWLLLRDPGNPGGPGRLVLAAGQSAEPRQAKVGGAKPDGLKSFAPAIRAGEKLIVEENTAVVDVRLEAVALEPAVAGAAFRVRLQVGGKVVRAVAQGPGRAALAPDWGVRP